MIKLVEKVIESIKHDPTYIVSANALQATDFNKIVTNHKIIDKIDHIFSNQIDNKVPPVDQQHAGVCWMCASMSVCRRAIINNLNLNPDFELSLNHLIFWDKLERCNYFMQHIIQNRNVKFDSAKISQVISSPISDGGYWHVFSDLVAKYGMVPDSVFKRRISSINTASINKLLKYKLCEFAALIMSPNVDRPILLFEDQFEQIENLRREFMAVIIRILVSMVGFPFYPDTQFEWTYVNKKGEKNIIKDLTPLNFYKRYCHINFDDFVPIMNDPRPRHPFNEMYEMRSTKYMIKDKSKTSASTTKSHIILNLEFDDMVKLIMKQIDDNTPVWFSCDVGKYSNHTHNIMDADLYDFGTLFGTSFNGMSKADRLDFNSSYPSHAMTIVGYDLDGECVAKVDVVNENDSDDSDESSESSESESESGSCDDCAICTKGSSSKKRKRKTDNKTKYVNKKIKLAAIKSFKTPTTDKVNRVVKFKVENSWGKIGAANGYYLMTKEWFRQYGYEIIIDKKHLSKQQKAYLLKKPNKMSKHDPLSTPLS